MEKRFVGFLVLSLLVMTVYVYLHSVFAPPRDPAPAPGDGQVAQEAPAADDIVVEDPVAEPAGTGEDVSREPEPQEAEPDEAQPAPARPRDVARRRVTLGSLDPDSPYRMLVTLTSRGAAVERIELNSSRYTDLEDRSGYLGHLALTDDGRGCRVNVVGPGTPAANAEAQGQQVSRGLQVGDIITAMDGEAVPGTVELQSLLQQTRPGQEIQLSVRREVDGQVRTLPFAVTLQRRPLEVIRPEPLEPDEEHPRHPLSFLLSLQEIGSRRVRFGQEEIPGIPSLRDTDWETHVIDTPDGPAVEFRQLLDRDVLAQIDETGNLEVVKRYRLTRVPQDEAANATYQAYHLTFEIELRNRADEPQTVAYRLDGPTGLPLEGWWYSYKTHPTSFGGAGTRDVVWRTVDGPHEMFTVPAIVKKAEKEPKSPATPLFEADQRPRMQYAGCDAQYFAACLLADEQNDPGSYVFQEAAAFPVAEIDKTKKNRTDVSFRLISRTQTIAPGEAYRQQFHIFAGPKAPELLAHYGLGDLIVFGWFGFVSKKLVLLLHFFYAIFRNYGIAIVLMTVLVRGCMFPLGRKQALNAQKMQELAPEMKKIADKYKNDMEKRSEAQRELFAKHNYNPFSGCLLVFLQLPIFIGLYRALSVDIALRQTPLIPGISWASNLAGPDMLLRWDSFMPQFLAGYTGWLGPYLNILPLISVSLFLVHQKLFTPPATDDQQKMQQQVMSFMTLFIGVLFFKVPAGLCLYFISSSLWGLAERKMLPKSKKSTTEDVEVKPAEKRAPTGGTNGTSKKRAKRKQRRR